MLVVKLQKLERLEHNPIGIHAIFGREKYLYTAELTLSAKGFTLVGKAKEERDLMTCMEAALMKLKEQLRRYESKRVEKLRRTAEKEKMRLRVGGNVPEDATG
jgi:ribosomal subunit interface protein